MTLQICQERELHWLWHCTGLMYYTALHFTAQHCTAVTFKPIMQFFKLLVFRILKLVFEDLAHFQFQTYYNGLCIAVFHIFLEAKLRQNRYTLFIFIFLKDIFLMK